MQRTLSGLRDHVMALLNVWRLTFSKKQEDLTYQSIAPDSWASELAHQLQWSWYRCSTQSDLRRNKLSCWLRYQTCCMYSAMGASCVQHPFYYSGTAWLAPSPMPWQELGWLPPFANPSQANYW